MSRHSDVIGDIFAGRFRDLAQKLSGEDGDEWQQQLDNLLHKRPTWPAVVPLFKPPSLTIPAQPEFSAEQFAKSGFWLSDQARMALGAGEDKVWLATTDEVRFQPRELDRQAVDDEIWGVVGNGDDKSGRERLTFTPGQLHYAMQNLLVKDGWYVAYVNGADSNFWAVSFYWSAVVRYWVLNARRAPDPHDWYAGYQFLVRDS